MIFRDSLRQEPWFHAKSESLNLGLLEAFKDDFVDPLLFNWHETRQLEYPWILHTAAPKGALLDVGHNLQFVCSMLGQGVKDITAHSTYHDVKSLGRLFPWLDNYRGGIFADKVFAKYKNDVQLVLGMLDRLTYIEDESFDTIYCISVIEHVLSDEVQPLIDGMMRLLKPGGTLAVTCDWCIDHPAECGVEGKIWNHDLGPRFAKHDVTISDPEIPWRGGFSASSWDGATTLYWDGLKFGVYGFTVTKHE